jgi:hypothetical protein
MLTANACTREGRSQLSIELCALEIMGQRRMLAELEELLDTVRLSPAQARDVCAEIEKRRAAIEEIELARKRLFSVRWYHRANGAARQQTRRAARSSC